MGQRANADDVNAGQSIVLQCFKPDAARYLDGETEFQDFARWRA